ncbi:MAG: cytochrome c oxidase subunit I [Acidimicrobiales bacterium]
MAITELPPSGPLALPGGDRPPTTDPARALGVFVRPNQRTGWKAWVTGVDHKKVGVMYGASALFFFVIGGLEALLIRAQLAQPNGQLVSSDLYSQLFTMHGVTMIFLVVMPLGAAFMNYLLPLQVGARDVAFPRLNALSFWLFIFGGLFLNSSWLLGGAPDGGWFAYAPNTNPIFSPSHGMDFYTLGLLITGIASTVGAVNLIVTVVNLRAPGMSLMKMPVFTWMALVTQFLLAFAMPVITVALFLLTFDRLFDANFFNVEAGADPLLWEHLFWIFGHPEVYILVLPAFGIISEIIPVFSRKPIFGYPFMVFSGIAIGFMGWGVWAHHMFASGVGPISVAAFSVSTMFIAVPTGVKILNWMATMWGGKIIFATAMKFSIGLVAMFTIGGLSGVTHAVAPSDLQQTDTYYIVAHFHYVIFGGALLGFYGGMYFWWPKAFGHKLGERAGTWHFWLTIIGMNLTFGPMHVVGLIGQPRRTYTYQEGYGFEIWNQIETVGAFIIAASFAVLLANIAGSYRKYKAAGRPAMAPDPWDARSLEWMTANPTPAHNFDEVPTVAHLDDFWHRKYAEDDRGRPVRIAQTADVVQKGDADPHLPSPSYWPIVLAFGMPVVAFGLIFNLGLAIAGGVIIFGAIYGWALEPSSERGHGDHDDHGAHDGDGDDGGAAAGLPAAAATAGDGDDADPPATPATTESEEAAPVG